MTHIDLFFSKSNTFNENYSPSFFSDSIPTKTIYRKIIQIERLSNYLTCDVKPGCTAGLYQPCKAENVFHSC